MTQSPSDQPPDLSETKARQASVEDMFSFLVSAITPMQHSLDRVADRSVGGARVRGWAPTEATLDVCALEFAEPRTVRTTPTGIVAWVWLPVDEEDLIG